MYKKLPIQDSKMIDRRKIAMRNKNPLFVDGRTVLFVDDEEKVLASLERTLRDEPYNILFACSGKETLEILRQQEVHVIVTDMRMPEMSGLELLRTVKTNYPHIIRMVLSGDANTDTLLGSINQGEIYRFIPKPWKSNELKTIIRQ
ncbi:MAG: response regulator, partial [Planctomycetes bacterium]|nr:response regulator [Planctomycetota bacterium]